MHTRFLFFLSYEDSKELGCAVDGLEFVYCIMSTVESITEYNGSMSREAREQEGSL